MNKKQKTIKAWGVMSQDNWLRAFEDTQRVMVYYDKESAMKQKERKLTDKVVSVEIKIL